MNDHCNNDELIKYIREDVKEIKKDIRDLMKFKWQIMGGSAVISAVVSFMHKYIGGV